MLVRPNLGEAGMDVDARPPQPAQRSGEVIADYGRWNEAALRRLHKMTGATLTWTEGTLGFSISIDGVVIGRLNRRPRGRPWTASLQGFERWHEPTQIIRRWHYTPVWAAPTLREAKKLVQQVIRTLPELPPYQASDGPDRG